MHCTLSLSFCIALTFLMGCEPMPTQDWRTDSELLRSIDLDNPQPEDVPALVALFEEHSFYICEAANRALVRIGEQAIPQLVDKLRPSEPRRVKSTLLRTFEEIGPSAIPFLVEALDDDGFDHFYILHALGKINPTTQEVVSALVDALDGEFVIVALYALGHLGDRGYPAYPELRAAVPAIFALLRDKNARVRTEAAFSLWRVDNDAARRAGVAGHGLTAPELPPLRDDPELLRRIDFDRPRPEHVSALLQMFDDHSHRSFLRASDSLIALGEPTIVPLVEAMRFDRPLLVRLRAAEVLRRLGPGVVSVVASAIEKDDVTRENRYDVPRLVYAVGTIEPLTSQALVLLLDTAKRFEAREFLDLLGWHGHEAREAVPALIPLLAHRRLLVRSAAASALWNIDREAARAAGLEGPRPPSTDR